LEEILTSLGRAVRKVMGVTRRWSVIFNAIIEYNNLMELHLGNRQFTWSNDHVVPTFEKLDRFLATTEWMDQYPLVQVTALTRYKFDHTPLLLNSGDRVRKSNQFKMELCWLAREDIHSIVDPIWGAPARDRSAIEE
jgi:hypothetical protein